MYKCTVLSILALLAPVCLLPFALQLHCVAGENEQNDRHPRSFKWRVVVFPISDILLSSPTLLPCSNFYFSQEERHSWPYQGYQHAIWAWMGCMLSVNLSFVKGKEAHIMVWILVVYPLHHNGWGWQGAGRVTHFTCQKQSYWHEEERKCVGGLIPCCRKSHYWGNQMVYGSCVFLGTLSVSTCFTELLLLTNCPLSDYRNISPKVFVQVYWLGLIEMSRETDRGKIVWRPMEAEFRSQTGRGITLTSQPISGIHISPILWAEPG